MAGVCEVCITSIISIMRFRKAKGNVDSLIFRFNIFEQVNGLQDA